ncbi:hypothetical protein [Persicitalea jodogahamensis]|uniref:Uncharacterized protein n=1 Tax=Persicitalea jodogahamensis TaxID=402147 RepID=A0A8J3DA81_9BACT|nr:hypothetical protein [Persicitalea jodogahamensis]GHB68076.1 hypothetical protein GCM10007390_21740 [Persicitalea jodogahamensis]
MTQKSRVTLLWFVHLLGLCAWGMDAPLLAQADSVTTRTGFGLVARLDIRRTRLDGRPGHINGALAGVRFGEKGHLLMMGYHWLGYDAPNNYIVWRGWLPSRIDLDFFTITDARFVSLGYWYPVFRSPKWYVAVPLEVGYGGETARYLDRITPGTGTPRFQLAQAGTFVNYRFIPWLGLNARAGYRSALFNPEFSRRFSGVYYGIGLAFYPVPAYNAYRDWHRSRVEKGGNQ